MSGDRNDKFPEGDPVEVRPPDSRAESQAGSNGPSGSPTSPSGRVLDGASMSGDPHDAFTLADARAALDVIEKVLRVHSGEDFTAGDFPTLEEGQAAWAMFLRLKDAVAGRA